MGYKIQGSDQSKNKIPWAAQDQVLKFLSDILKKCKKLNNSSKIFSNKNNNCEIILLGQKIPIYSRAEVLADVALKKNIIITGSHEKTTMTSLIKNTVRSKTWSHNYKWRCN